MKASLYVIICFVVLNLSCGSDDSSTTTSTPVSIQFSALAGEQSINCDTSLTNLGTSATSATLNDLKFYIHDLTLSASDGSTIEVILDENSRQANGIALLDFQNRKDGCAGEENEAHTAVTGVIAHSVSSITGITFTLGIPEEYNHQEMSKAAAPLNISSMQWNWNAGYKFLRADVAPEGGISRPSDAEFSVTSFNIHLGSTGCIGEAAQGEVTCSKKNRAVISLDKFDMETSTIAFDYAELIKGVDLKIDEGVAPGCMSGAGDPECSSIFSSMGLDFDTGNQGDTKQSIFSVK